ncbi:heme peroxidase [Aspergillus recurvatus]
MAPFIQNGSDTEDLSSSKPKQPTFTSLLSSVHADLLSQAHRIPADIRTLRGLSQAGLQGGLIDDKKYLAENIIQVLASLPNTSTLRTKITDTFIKTLWDNLQHPPLSYIGDEFRYRRADGSFNNVMYPHLGASGSHYARTVTPKHPRPTILPDPGLIFDSLLARQGPAREHPAKISSNLFYFAIIIIHDLFRTDEADPTRVKNSSYLDLGPLYGHDQTEQAQVRTYIDGLLKPDTFAEKRLLSQPPGVCALMIAFNRFHNYVVTELARINEAGRFDLPTGAEEKSPDYVWALQKRDEDLFQTGRLVTCGLYVSIILNDYLRTILNLNDNPTNSDWKLDPRKAPSVFDSEGLPRGIGNQVSAEFNMIYRWHAMTSNEDEKWLNELSSRAFGGKVDPSTLSVQKYLNGLHEYLGKAAPGEPNTWTFGGLKRRKDGMFADKDLVTLLNDGCENVSGAFGARNTPKAMKAIEMRGIQKGREWGLATLNELRAFFKLKPHSTFTDVNSDPEVAEALEALYGHPDNIELYVGVQAEEAKKPFLPGSGLCPGFTISFAILSDAVALVRGDRFYTVDYSPVNLTNFGFNTAESDPDVANGGVMYKLLMRAFPGWYEPNNVYALYPFTTPAKNKEVFEKYGRADTLEFKRPEYTRPPVAVTSWKGVVELLNDPKGFHVPWGKNTFRLTKHDYMLSGDAAANAEQRTFMAERLYRVPDALEQVRRFYESITVDLIQRNSKKLGSSSCQIDIVRDVCNLVHAYFCSEFFDIPLKHKDGHIGNGSGNKHSSTTDAYTPKELAEALFAQFAYVFLDIDPVQSRKNRVVAYRETQRMGNIMTQIVSATSESGYGLASASGYLFSRPSRIFGGKSSSDLSMDGYGPQLVKRLREGGRSVEEVVWMIIPTAAAACATQAMGWAQMLDLYLSDRYSTHWPAIQKLAHSDEPEAFEKLKKYALEGFRLSTPANGVLRTCTTATTTLKDGTATKSVSKGDTVFADFASAGRDPESFPNPEEIRLDRPLQLYIHHGWGAHACLGRAIVTTAGAALLKVVGRLEGLRRAEGLQGELVRKEVGEFRMYLDESGNWGVYPRNMKVVFDSLDGLKA